MHEPVGKIFVKTRKFIKRYTSSLDNVLVHRISRSKAHHERKLIINKKGRTIVDNKLKKKIKEYSSNRFGTSSYWPWLATYTELRGEFLYGWIPYDFFRFKILASLNPGDLIRFSEVKSFDYKIFKDLMIKPLFIRVNNQFFSPNSTLLDDAMVKKTLEEYSGEVVIKPDTGLGGHGIMFVNSKELNLDQLPEGINLVVQPSVKQHSYLNKINPYSVNTFRVFTYFNKGGKIDIMLVKLRFGRGKNRVDNSTAGGGYIPILSNGIFHDTAYDKNNNIIGDRHPDTGTKFSKIKLPFYNDIINLCKDAHSKFPYVGIIGWDVCVLEDGSPLLLEWNANNPGFWSYEATFGPIWPEKDLREYKV